jgi:hypothetical protein
LVTSRGWWTLRHDEWVGLKLLRGKIGNLQSEIDSIFGAQHGFRTPNQQIMRLLKGINEVGPSKM